MSDKIEEILEDNDWGIAELNNYGKESCIEIEKYTTQGEDFSFGFRFSGADDDFVKNVSHYTLNFDVNEHAAELIKNRGKYGIPESVRVIIDSADEIKRMLLDLCAALEECIYCH